MNPWSAVELESYADEFAVVAQSLQRAAKLMREKKLGLVHLNADTAFGSYRAAIVRLAALIEGEIRNQSTASTKGIDPEWVVNQRKNAAAKSRSEMISHNDSEALFKERLAASTKPTKKKPAKKRGK